MPSIGPLELAIVLVIVLLIFGPKRLPGLGRQLGTGMREFKESITGRDKGEEPEEIAEPKPLPAAASPAASQAQPPSAPAEPGSENRPAPGA